jgi:acyl-CoA synthetase (AMP-forming)/AMP-acid ligase II
VLDHGHANLGRQADFFSDGELFIIGRIKDLLIVYGHNHFPDDIEAIIQEITGDVRGDRGSG